MEYQTDRQRLRRQFPVTAGDLGVRLWERDDVDRLALWPPYPFPFERFDLGYRAMSQNERDRAFEKFGSNPDRLLLIGDTGTARTVMFVSLNSVGGNTRVIGNMAYRIHPSWCDRGVGTQFIQLITERSFAAGIEVFRFDVAASNPRAIRCYEKAGFRIVDEFWRQDEDILGAIDISQPAFDYLRPHVRRVTGGWELRFHWMEREA